MLLAIAPTQGLINLSKAYDSGESDVRMVCVERSAAHWLSRLWEHYGGRENYLTKILPILLGNGPVPFEWPFQCDGCGIITSWEAICGMRKAYTRTQTATPLPTHCPTCGDAFLTQDFQQDPWWSKRVARAAKEIDVGSKELLDAVFVTLSMGDTKLATDNLLGLGLFCEAKFKMLGNRSLP